MSKESEEYERAKAEYVSQIVEELNEVFARTVIREIFGGTPEQQEEMYQELYVSRASKPD